MSNPMSTLALVCYASVAVPLAVATWANRRTSLLHTIFWTWLCWLVWGLALSAADRRLDYVALCLTGCAGIAVFGARRPGVAAWNFVVTGLMVILLLPLAEGAATDTEFDLGWFRIIFLIGLLGMTITNYLPTWLALGAVWLFVACWWVMAGLLTQHEMAQRQLVALSLAPAPWLAWLCWWIGQLGRTDFDRRWLAFRDRYGLVWGLRLREQFNHSAAAAGWDAKLTWAGLRRGPALDDDERTEMEERLAALMKRFMPE
jgi:hypothetical protein